MVIERAVDPAYVFALVFALLFVVPIVMAGVFWMAFRRAGRAVRLLLRSALVSLVFAPTFVTVHHFKYGNVRHGPVPASLLEALIIKADAQGKPGPEPQSTAALLIPVAIAWILLSSVALWRPPRWPERLNSMGGVLLLSWGGLLLIPATVAISYFLGRSEERRVGKECRKRMRPIA